MTYRKIRPLQTGDPMVDSRGAALPAFARLWQQLFGNGDTTNTTANAALTGLDAKVDKTTQIIAGDGLTGTQDLSSDVTLNVGAGTGITVNANDVAIDLTAEAERTRDTIGTALVQGTGITITPNDGADTITIAATGGGTTTNALTVTDSGGASPGATFNGSSAITIDYSTVGAPSTAQMNAAIAAASGSGGTIPDGIVSGCGVFYSGSGLTFNMSAGSFYLDNTLHTATAQSVTLSTADATNPRIDALYVDDSGVFGKVTGTPALDPSQPAVDPTTQLYLTFVLVPATATTISGITNENIYREGTEWTGSTSGSGFTVGSTNNPFAGTKDVEGTAVAAGAYVKFVRSSAMSFDGTGNLTFEIRSKASWNVKRWLTFQWYLAGVAKGVAVSLKSGTFGFNSATTGSYQLIVISKTQFSVPSGTNVDELRIVDVGGSIGFYLDEIILQNTGTSTGGGGTTSGITQAQADARYLQLTGGTLTGPLVVPDDTYDATTWNGSNQVPTKNAVRDKIESLGGGGGSGTVTSVSVTTANGVSGSVATSTTTPAITLTLGAITPSSVVASGSVTGSNLSGTNTGDQTITLTGNVTGSGTGSFATTIAAGVVTLAMQANMATASVVYRKTSGSGAPEVNTLTTLKNDLGLTGTNSGDQTITLTGDVTGSGTGSFAATLATVNSNTGSFGSSTLVPVITVNAKGLITAVSTAAVSGGGGSVTTSGSPASGNLATFSGSTAITNGDLSGDVTTSGTLAATIANNAVTTAKINNAAVTLAKIANASASSKLVGSGAAGSGAAYAEIALGTGLSMSGTTLNASATATAASTPTIVQSASVCDDSVTGSVTFGAAPTAGNLLVAIGTKWSSAAAATTGWIQLFNEGTQTDDIGFIFYKTVAAGESATQAFSTNVASGWGAVVFEIAGSGPNGILTYFADGTLASSSSAAANIGVPKDNCLGIGLFMAQLRTNPTLTISGATTIASVSDTTVANGGPRTLSSMSQSLNKGAWQPSCSYTSSGINGYAVIVLGGVV